MGLDVFDLYAKISANTKEYESALGKAASMGKSVMNGIGNVAKIGMGVAAAAIGTGTVAMGAFGKGALDAYASYEQLSGGVEKLFGTGTKATETLMKNAENAYKTAGMSSNKYMETATSFSASLLKSLDGDAEKAAEITDVAMRAMSDNANTFGTDMESVSNAIMGFAKNNFTMLDNLKLGFSGSKEGMEQLIARANELREANGEAADLSIDSFADMITAVQLVQENLGVAGTTAKEAMTTIEGSANATKAAWENLKTAIGRGEGVTEAFTSLKEAIFGVGLTEDGEETGLLNQIIPRIQTIMSGAGDAIVEASPLIAEKLPQLVEAILPPMIDGGIALAGAIGTGLLQALPSVWESVTTATSTIGDYVYNGMEKAAKLTEDVDFKTPISTALDKVDQFINGEKVQTFIDNGFTVVENIANGIGQAAPDVIPKAAEVVSKFVEGITDNIPQIIDAGVSMVEGLVVGLVRALPTLLSIPIRIKIAVIQHFAEMGANLLAKAQEIFPKLLAKVQEVVSQIPEKFRYYAGYAVTTFILELGYLIYRLPEIGKKCLNKIIEFGKQLRDKGKESAKNFGDAVIEWFTDFPEKLRQLGEKLGGALVNGFKSIVSGIGDIINGAGDAVDDFKERHSKDALKSGGFYNATFEPMQIDSYSESDSAGINYEHLANAIVQAFLAADIGVECDSREFGRLVRKAVMA